MTEMDELKPCPFCGYAPTGEEELLDILDVDEFGEKVEKIKYVGVSCAGCCAYVPVQTHDKTEAIAAWNRRPSLSPAVVTEEQVEAAAKRIFEHWQFTKPTPAIPSDGVPAWVEGGNSLMQDKARAFARAALEAAAKAQPSLPAGVTDTEARAFAVAYEKSCNHRYDMGAIRAALETAAKVLSPADAKGDA